MYVKLQRLIDRHSYNFISGNIRPILPLYAPVLPVYIAGNRVTLGSTDEIAVMLESHFLDIKRKCFDCRSPAMDAFRPPLIGLIVTMLDSAGRRAARPTTAGWKAAPRLSR